MGSWKKIWYTIRFIGKTFLEKELTCFYPSLAKNRVFSQENHMLVIFFVPPPYVMTKKGLRGLQPSWQFILNDCTYWLWVVEIQYCRFKSDRFSMSNITVGRYWTPTVEKKKNYLFLLNILFRLNVAKQRRFSISLRGSVIVSYVGVWIGIPGNNPTDTFTRRFRYPSPV